MSNVPNPRDRVKRKEFYDNRKQRVLEAVQVFVFVLAVWILIAVSL